LKASKRGSRNLKLLEGGGKVLTAFCAGGGVKTLKAGELEISLHLTGSGERNACGGAKGVKGWRSKSSLKNQRGGR